MHKKDGLKMTKKRNIDTVSNSSLNDFTAAAVDSTTNRGTSNSYYQSTNSEYLTLNEILLLNAWQKKGMIRTFICLPVDDALKDGVEISADNLDDEACKRLEEIFKIKGAPAVKETAYWARHFGGGGLIVLSGDQKLNEPFNKEKLGQTVSFMAVDRWRLPARAGYTQDFIDVAFSKNAIALDLSIKDASNRNKIQTVKGAGQVNGKPVDNSRINIMMGDIAPLITRQAVSGWGLSVYEKVAEDFDSYEKGMTLIHELMEEGKVNVVKVDGLIRSLSAGKFANIIEVMTSMTRLKKQIKTLIIDGKDDFQQTQATLSGYEGAISVIMTRLAAGLRIPQTKYYGTAPAGFSNDDGSIDNYNDMINSTVRPKMRPLIQEILEIQCASELKVLPKNLQFKFRPLREIKPKEQEEINKMKFERFMALHEAELITDKELKDKLERHDLI